MSLTIAAHQPAYLFWCGLADKIASADEFVIFDVCPMDTSSSTSFENRNRILTRSGPLWLTVPVRRVQGQALSDVMICTDQNWRRKHWRSIELAYARAPYWKMHAPWLEDFYRAVPRKREWPHDNLTNLCDEMLRAFLAVLGVNVRIHRASTMGLAGTKSELVLDMCKQLGADRYIFGALGRSYCDVAAFRAAGVEPVFQDYRHPTYPQQWGGAFVPYMSVLDLLMNVGPRSLEVLRGAHTA